MDDVTSRAEGTLSTLTQLFTNVRNSRHPEAATIKGENEERKRFSVIESKQKLLIHLKDFLAGVQL